MERNIQEELRAELVLARQKLRQVEGEYFRGENSSWSQIRFWRQKILSLVLRLGVKELVVFGQSENRRILLRGWDCRRQKIKICQIWPGEEARVWLRGLAFNSVEVIVQGYHGRYLAEGEIYFAGTYYDAAAVKALRGFLGLN